MAHVLVLPKWSKLSSPQVAAVMAVSGADWVEYVTLPVNGSAREAFCQRVEQLGRAGHVVVLPDDIGGPLEEAFVRAHQYTSFLVVQVLKAEPPFGTLNGGECSIQGVCSYH